MDGSGSACCGACAFAVEVAKAGGAKPNPNEYLSVPIDSHGAPLGVSLLVTSDYGWIKHVPMRKAYVVLGRCEPSDVILDDGRLSSRQFSVDFTHGKVIVADMRSACGTYVNGEGIPYGGSRALRAGDTVHVGGLVIEVRLV